MKKKRWWPEPTGRFWFIYGDDDVDFGFTMGRTPFQLRQQFPFGVYKTKAAAIKMRNKIKALVEKELGK